MKKTLPLFLLITAITLNACAPMLPATQPVLAAPTQITILLEPHTPTAPPPTPTEQPPATKSYANSAFGLAFNYPSAWFGPEEYISDQTLRVEVGSDTVYPYGEPPAQPSSVVNSYNVVIQYTKNNQNPTLNDTYQALQKMKDGDSFLDVRSLTTRIRQLEFGRFTGFEYIVTLPETAQTDHIYLRQVILFDQQTNDQLTIMGQPTNVEVTDGADWRTVYQSIDQANLAFFHQIAESLTIQ